VVDLGLDETLFLEPPFVDFDALEELDNLDFPDVVAVSSIYDPDSSETLWYIMHVLL